MKGNGYKGNAVIVEDDNLLSLVEERLLDKLGYKVVGKAQFAEEAIDMVRELEPDFVLMDISLKGEMDGIEAVQEIREFSDVSVIYLSGTSDKFNYERAKKTGFIDYLVKPITADDLVGPLRRAVSDDSTRIKKGSERSINRAS